MPRLGKPLFRRLAIVLTAGAALAIWLIVSPNNYQPEPVQANTGASSEFLAATILEKLDVKPKYTAQKYIRTDFYSNWSTYKGCDMRNVILQRDLSNTTLDECTVKSGTLHDPYTANTINFVRGPNTSSAVQIDHVVALSNAWATGAFNLDKQELRNISQDPLNLLAVDGAANQQKSDQDASEWLPPNTTFHCQYVARQISVKYKYILWITEPEKTAMQKVLNKCPNEPTIGLEDQQTNQS